MRKGIPDKADLKKHVEAAHKKFAAVKDGKNASYIPYLAKVPSGLFGIAVMTVDGTLIEAGDTRYAFAIESISKVFNMALAMEDIGPAELRKRIGANPTGEPFNSVMAIELHRGKPLNPCVNAGAMATVSLVKASSAHERWSRLLKNMCDFAGRKLPLNDEVYESEAKTNQHNRGIAWLLQSYGYMHSDPIEACDVYTKGCSVDITAVDLATMGATLAAAGVNPATKKRVIARSHIPKILAEITMNGLYDSTGDWLYRVGLPGKSGVGGGILAVVPDSLAIAAFSPPLDIFGNSVRGQQAAEYLSRELNLNLFIEDIL